MKNVIECNRCKKKIIAEEHQEHLCSPLLIGSKDIPIDYYVITRDVLGRDAILAKGLDGIMYTLIKHIRHTNLNTPNKHTDTEQYSELYIGGYK